MTGLYIGLLTGLVAMGAGIISKTLTDSWETIPRIAFLCSVLIEAEVLSLTATCYAKISMGGLPLSEQKSRRRLGWGKIRKAQEGMEEEEKGAIQLAV